MVDYNNTSKEVDGITEESFRHKRVAARVASISEAKIPLPRAGNLQKLSPSFFAGWQTRRVELVNRVLKYYKVVDKQNSEM